MSYLNLEHKLLKEFKTNQYPKNIVVCISGGMDSVALLHGLNTLAKQLQIHLKALCIHHGYLDDVQQNNFRDLAADFTKKLCNSLEIEYESNYISPGYLKVNPDEALRSEAKMREFRESIIQEFSEKWPTYTFAFGHHKQDLLENRLIQMIRGSSTNGFLSLKKKNGIKIRPLLNVNKSEIKAYLKEKGVGYVSDPSNNDKKYLRNWIRHTLLAQLEEFRPGSVSTLSQSLQNLADELTDHEQAWSGSWAKVYNAERQSYQLTSLWLLNLFEQRKCIAKILEINNVQNFNRNQLDEVLKRLDSQEKVHKFDMLELNWDVRNNELKVEQK